MKICLSWVDISACIGLRYFQIANVIMDIFRKLTKEQKALLLSFAETEDNVEGTINGIAQTKKGKTFLPIYCLKKKKPPHILVQ